MKPILIPTKLHQRLKVAAASAGKSLAEYTEELIAAAMAAVEKKEAKS